MRAAVRRAHRFPFDSALGALVTALGFGATPALLEENWNNASLSVFAKACVACITTCRNASASGAASAPGAGGSSRYSRGASAPVGRAIEAATRSVTCTDAAPLGAAGADGSVRARDGCHEPDDDAWPGACNPTGMTGRSGGRGAGDADDGRDGAPEAAAAAAGTVAELIARAILAAALVAVEYLIRPVASKAGGSPSPGGGGGKLARRPRG